MTTLFVAILALPMLGISPVAAKSAGTGTLYMYTDNTCATLLPQAGGIKGYILPSTGTVIGIEVKGISGTSSSPISLLLQFTGEPNEFISGVTLSSGNTNCVAWTVGTFGGVLQSTPSTCTTGNVNYGPNDDTQVSDFNKTISNGGSDGGHFYWGTGSDGDVACSSTTTGVPQFPGVFGLLLVIGSAVPLIILMRRRLPSFRI
ncbi:MAG: hypothetical protein ACREBS_08190 [Nitrososphaerales archaeon]